MRNRIFTIIAVGGFAASLAGCATTMPEGPTLTAMPTKGKSYERFQQDDSFCRGQASTALAGATPEAAQSQSTANGAVVGAAAGALAGAAIGSASAQAGTGAAIGAGVGILTGAAVGSNNGVYVGRSVQARYDTVYAQCMVAKGDEITSPPAPEYVYGPGPYYYGYPYGPHWGGGYYHRFWW